MVGVDELSADVEALLRVQQDRGRARMEESFQSEVVPVIRDLGGEVLRYHYVPPVGELRVVILLNEFTWMRRRCVLDVLTSWEQRYRDGDAPVAVVPVVLEPADLEGR